MKLIDLIALKAFSYLDGIYFFTSYVSRFSYFTL